MAEKLEGKEMVTFEELLMSNVIEQEALINLLERKGIITKAEVLEEIGPFGSSLKKTELVPEGIPVVGIENVLPNQFVSAFRRYITKKKYQELSDYTILPADVLVTTMGTIGRAAVAPEGLGIAIFDSHLFKMRVNTGLIDPNYLCYAINSEYVASQLSQMSRGSIMEGLNTTILRECVVPLPSLVKQKLIVDLLMEADRVRRARRYTLELSETLLTDYFLSTFKEYLMQGPSTSLKEVLSQPLSNGFFKKKEAYGNGNGVPVIWVDNLYETITVDLTKLRRAEVSYEERKKYEVAEGDLLFTRSSLVRTGIGQINIVPVLKEPILFECHIIRARVERNKVNPFYLLGLYRSRFGKELILKRANTATMTTISQEALEELPCPLPPFRLQNQFEGLVRKVQYLQCMQREALRQGEHLFKTFLYQSFSGK